MTEDTILDRKTANSGSEDVVEQLEQTWENYRLQVWKKQDFETRLKNAKMNQEMGKAVRAACAVLRQSNRELVECQRQVDSLKRAALARRQAI